MKTRVKLSFNLILTLAVILSMAQTAWAADETKTFENATIQKGNTGQLTYNGEILFSAVGNETVKKSTSSGQVTLLPPINDAGEVEEGTVRFYPRISGKVKSIVFSSAYTTTAGGYVKFGKGSTWTNPVSETMTGNNAWTSISFTNSDGIQLDNEGDYLEIKLFGTANDGGGIISNGSITVTYEATSSVQTHTHNFSYSQNGSTLTATCAHNDGMDCSLASDNWQISTTLTPPTHATYAPNVSHPATLSNIAGFTTETGATAGDITYVNNTTSESLGTSSPHDVGAYTASVTINAGGTDYTLTTSFRVGTFSGINTNYPQFTTDKEGNYAIDGETVTLTFTPQFGETLTGVTATGATSGNDITLTAAGANTYTFTMPGENVNIGATFSISANDFAQTGENEYTIKTNNGWNWFCFALNYGLISDGFNGKTVKLATDVESSEMAGTSGHPFKGTFDGQNHTLTFNRTAAEEFCAPFHYINGTTISNLHVQGTITGGTYGSLGGLVGHAEGNITIENCHVSTQISTTVSGSALHGGFIGVWNGTNATCTVTGCVYDGLIYNPDEAGVTASCRGFIGWDYGNNGTIKFTDCLSAPAAYGTGKYALYDNCYTFVYPNSEPTLTYNMTNCYYTTALGNRQGRPAATATTAPADLGKATTDHGLVKGYENGFLYNGNYYTPKYGDAIVEYAFDDWNERASVTFNGNGNNLVGVNITEEVGNIKSVTYNRPFYTGEATTVILPFNYECNGNEGGTFYNFNAVTYDQGKLEWVCKIIAPGEDGSNNVTSLTANTPYLFMPTAEKMTFPNITNMTGGVVTLQPTTLNVYGGATTNDNWNFYGTYTGKNWTEWSKDYGFAACGGVAVQGVEEVVAGQFVRYTEGASIGPMRCYLRYTGDGELKDPNPVEGVPTLEVPWWDGNDGYESTEIFNTVAHNINITAPTNGSVTATVGETANPTTAFKGDTVNLTVTPDAGYTIKSVKYNDTNATKNADGTYSFSMPAENVTVTAEFKRVYSDGIGEHLAGHSLSLNGNIGVNFYMELDADVIADPDAYMLFTLPNGTTQTVKVSDATVDTTTVSGKTYYVFQCSVAAKEMTDTIKAQMFSGEKQGEEYSYTVKQYADYLFANAYEADGTTVKNQAYADAIKLIEAMVNYGAYSQLYFNHNTDSPANADITATNVRGVTAETVNKTYDGSTNTLPDGVTLAGANLELESETVMNLYFTNTTGKALTFTTSGNIALVQEQSGEYTKVTITGIAAQYLDSDVTVNIALEGDDNAYSVKYSPMNYCYNVLARETTATRTEALKDVMRAFYLYNKEAKAYFASHNN